MSPNKYKGRVEYPGLVFSDSASAVSAIVIELNEAMADIVPA